MGPGIVNFLHLRLGGSNLDRSGVLQGVVEREKMMPRRVFSFLILSTLIGAQAAPLAAGGRRCATSPSAHSGLCAVCVISGAPGSGASVSAGSCCRFEAASPTAQTPGVVPSAQRAHETGALALLQASMHWDAMSSPGVAHADLQTPRSTDSPVSLHSTLRL